eukprot:6463854-Amphidinium_carterae.2
MDAWSAPPALGVDGQVRNLRLVLVGGGSALSALVGCDCLPAGWSALVGLSALRGDDPSPGSAPAPGFGKTAPRRTPDRDCQPSGTGTLVAPPCASVLEEPQRHRETQVAHCRSAMESANLGAALSPLRPIR